MFYVAQARAWVINKINERHMINIHNIHMSGTRARYARALSPGRVNDIIKGPSLLTNTIESNTLEDKD